MGALVLGWISSKSIFFIASAIVAMTVIGYLMHRHHRSKEVKRMMGLGEGREFGDRAADGVVALAADTDPSIMKGKILSMMDDSTDDTDMLDSQMPEIQSKIDSHLQPGGTLDELKKERASGAITPKMYREKLVEFVKQQGADHDIPMHGKNLVMVKQYPHQHARTGAQFKRIRHGGQWVKQHSSEDEDDRSYNRNWGLGEWDKDFRKHRDDYQNKLRKFGQVLDETVASSYEY